MPVSQHWVPRFYLKYFSTPESRDAQNPRIFVHDRDCPGASCRLEATRDVCALPYLYTPAQLDGERDWAMEETFARIENKLARMWPQISESTGTRVDDLKKAHRGIVWVIPASRSCAAPWKQAIFWARGDG
jgi:hypothetical protein